MDVTVEFLEDLDQLVQLIESPIFSCEDSIFLSLFSNNFFFQLKFFFSIKIFFSIFNSFYSLFSFFNLSKKIILFFSFFSF